MPQTESPAAQTAATRQLDGFEAFYRDSYKEVVKAAMTAGATFAEAEDAASKTFLYMLQRWPVNGAPLTYARKAVVNAFVKDKTRGTARVAQRLIQRGHASPHGEAAEETGLSTLEGRDWVAGVLSHLTPAQREVMERVARGLTRQEIAEDLGKSQDAVRRRLCDARARLVQVLNLDGSTAGQSRPAAERPPREETP